jgi:cell division septum initiation protein DivIVA
MTDAKSDSHTATEAAEAMNEVLQAEREAARAVGECEQQAEKLLSAAQARAQRLVRRADQRITAIQMRCNHRIENIIRQIGKQRPAADGAGCPDALGEQTIRAVIADLAVELTSREEVEAGERPAAQ